jgi:hypothetical protein
VGEKHDFSEQARQSLEQKTSKFKELLSQSCYHFETLRETDVPETIGVYIIYDHRSSLPIYVGKAQQVETKQSGKPTGLRFRIMHNHLGRAGDDSFLRHLARHLGVDKKQAVQYVKHHCSCQWMELEGPREAFLLEHLAIGLLDPCLNRG